MRSETALVRPFARIVTADKPLDEVIFTVGGKVVEPGSVVLPSETLSAADFRLTLPAPDAVRSAVESTCVPMVDCGLVVLGTAHSHRASQVFLQQYLRIADWPTEMELHRNDADLILNDSAGFTLTVAVVLLNDLSAEPLRPSMAGTWLARREFRVSPEAVDASFSPEELTDEVRKFHNLPNGVLRYVHVDEVLEEETLSDAVHVYVDPEVLRLLLANPADSSAVQLQVELAIQTTETVAVAIARDLTSDGSPPTPEMLEGRPAAKRFYENLARTLKCSVADALELSTNQCARLRSHLEGAFDMRKVTSSALREK